MICEDDRELLSFSVAFPAPELRAFLDGLGENAVVDCRSFEEEFYEGPYAPHDAAIEPGFISSVKMGADCCRDHPEPPTITAIRSRPEDALRRAVLVTASHACGIREISIYLAEGRMVRSRSGRGLTRVPFLRRRNDGSLLGDTWTRGDSTDATPQTAVSIFPVDQFVDFNNAIVARVVNTCGRATTAETAFFDRPAVGPF